MARPSKAKDKARFGYERSTLQEMAEDVLRAAKKIGASDCEVDVSEGLGQSVTVRLGEVETIEHNHDKGLSITVYVGQQKGHASTSDFSKKALQETVEAAYDIARFTALDTAAGLAEPHLLATAEECKQELNLYHPWSLDIDSAIALAKRAEDAAFSVSPDITNSEGATLSTQEGHFISANSRGFCGGYPSTQHYIACSVIAGREAAMQRDDWYSNSRNPKHLASPEAIGDYAARRALSRQGARQIKTCDVPVLFEAPLAASLIGHFVHAASGGSLYRKSSFLIDRLGQKVFSDIVNISERPHLPEGLASSLFDSDGVRTQDREVVSDGTLAAYFLSVYSARKLGLETTGNAGGSHNLIVHPGDTDFRGLLKTMRRGLLVTELLGHGINYVTGDYSRGAAGYWVEDGEIAYPVQEVTIAGNLSHMFQDIIAIGNDVLIRGSKQTGSILVGKMTVAGASSSL